jgi:hypothetical protein
LVQEIPLDFQRAFQPEGIRAARTSTASGRPLTSYP